MASTSEKPSGLTNNNNITLKWGIAVGGKLQLQDPCQPAPYNRLPLAFQFRGAPL